MIVRAANASDAQAIGEVHVRSWQAVYRGQFPQDFLDGLDPVRRAEQWSGYFRSGPHPRDAILVGEAAGEVIGFANVGPSRDDGAPVGEGEVRAIYLMCRRSVVTARRRPRLGRFRRPRSVVREEGLGAAERRILAPGCEPRHHRRERGTE